MSIELIRLRLRLGGVSVPDHMHGDNLAILLATFYEDADGVIDENGWTELALEATEKTLDAIHAHYADAWNKRTRKESLQDEEKIARYRYVMEGVLAAIETGRNEPLQIWKEQIEIALDDAFTRP